MATLQFFIPFQRGRNGKVRPHPGMNEFVDARGVNRYAYADLKRTYTQLARMYAERAAAAQRWECPKGRVRVYMLWKERDRRRDPDNVEAGAKWVLDGCVAAGAIAGDSQRWVADVWHRVEVDKGNPGVLVALIEDEEG